MNENDDDLLTFEANGAPALPIASESGFVSHDGAQIWYATFGEGQPVILLHGGLGHSGNWGNQVPAIANAGYRCIVVDSRGHGRSTRDSRPYSYELMASDVLAVMDHLNLDSAALVGWSDGACVALILGLKHPDRVGGVFFFGCNMDPSGTKEFEFTPNVQRCFARHQKDYAALSATPDEFDAFADAVSLMMQTEPNYSAEKLSKIRVRVAIVQSEHDEFIKPEHAEYLAKSIPGAELLMLPAVSHFAPLQRPGEFNQILKAFLKKVSHG